MEGDVDIRRREAAEWFARLNQRKVTIEDVKGFSDWRRDPENARVFQRLEAMWEAAGALASDPEMAALTQAAATPASPVEKRPFRTGRLIPLGIGALTLIVLTIGGLWLMRPPLQYETTVGERRVVHLADGSKVTLDTASELTVRFSGAQRRVVLVSGQAMFDVEGDARRPFIVEAGDAQVTATGTRFDVRRAGAGARVILVEGKVDVLRETGARRRWTLAPGQQVTTSAPRPAVDPVNIAASTSWTVGRLTFENTPISEAVAEVNRYSRTPILLQDGRLSSVRVSGVFNAGDTDGFVAALSDLYDLTAVHTPDGGIALHGSTGG